MAETKDEENNNEANSSSWWGSWPSWLQTAKEKSSTALEFMKRDLTEFSQVVQTDAVAAVSSTATILKEKLTIDNAEAVAGKARQSFTSVLETITDVFAPHKELEEGEPMIIKNSEPVTMDWWQAQLYSIRKDPKTFCHEPEGPPEMYETWLESFHPEEHQEEMTEIMMTCSEIRSLYDKLVPTSVSHLEFWHRYFYRVHLLKKAESKRADLMRRAEQISIEDVEWDEDCTVTDELDLLSSQDKGTLLSPSTAPSAGNTNSLQNPTHTNKSHTICNTELILGTSQPTPEETITVEPKKFILKDQNTGDIPPCTEDANTKTDDNVNSEMTDIHMDPSSADSTDGSRSSPIESLGKDSSTGDDWEKDFDLEINENDLIKDSLPPDSRKEDEDDWEKWQ